MTTVDQLLTVKEVAKRLRLTPGGIYKLAQEKRIPTIYVGSRLRFSVKAIDAYLESRTTGKSKTKAAEATAAIKE
jgi:excisionase family DNA binding protein